MINLDEQAYPSDRHAEEAGLTKRERACIDLRVPESGDEELDELIRMANKRDTISSMVRGLATEYSVTGEAVRAASSAIEAAKAVEAALK